MSKRRVFLLSRSQWLGMAVLLLMLGAVWLCLYLLPSPLPMAPSRQETDSVMVKQESKEINRKHRFQRKKIVYQPQFFDPNTADSVIMVETGIPPYVVHGILRYRDKGGVFRQPEKLRKIYNMTDSVYFLVEPWIRIDTVRFADTVSLKQDTTIRYISHKRDTVIELNSADTTSLQYIRGIGPYYALRIIRYREELGGYHSPEQVLEIDGVRFAKPDSVLLHLMAAEDSIRPIHINTASVQRLVRHPYISFEQARDIYDLRRRKGRLNSITDLQRLKSLSERDLERLYPYLSFEK